LGIFDLFDFVVGADMVTHNKPHPEMIEKTLHVLNIDTQKAVLVGDSIVDMQMGEAAEIGLVVGVLEGGIAAKKDLDGHSDVVIDSVRNIRVLQTI
jgi:phosphoglycolate phosphatase